MSIYLHHLKEEDILAWVEKQGVKNEDGWVRIHRRERPKLLARLDELVSEGKLQRQLAWKNHASPEAQALGKFLEAKKKESPNTYMVGHDKDYYLYRIPPRHNQDTS